TAYRRASGRPFVSSLRGEHVTGLAVGNRLRASALDSVFGRPVGLSKEMLDSEKRSVGLGILILGLRNRMKSFETMLSLRSTGSSAIVRAGSHKCQARRPVFLTVRCGFGGTC